jgi:dihydropteroate synthase
MVRAWQCGRFHIALDRPLVMGVLNVTPDSFSDGGRFLTAENAIDWGSRLVADGAAILDIGGESTRPGSAEVTLAEEIGRVVPVLRGLAEAPVPLSIDTRHADVARAALGAGASIINDVSGFRDPDMVATLAESGAGALVMHMLGEPGTMQDAPRYDDVVSEVADYLGRQASLLVDAGVAPERIAIDPGIGFGKTVEHNLELLARLDEIAALGFPVVVGVSRKRFIGALTGVEVPAERLAGSLGAALAAIDRGAHVVRVHDVASHVEALSVWSAIRGAARPVRPLE